MSKKQVIIINTDAVATTFAQARAGQLGFMVDGAIAGAVSATGENQFTAGGYTSQPFKVSEVVDAVKTAPSTGTAGVGTVDFAGAFADHPLYVKLINTTIGTMDVPMKSFESATLQGIVDAINTAGQDAGSEFFGFTASLTTTVITVTAPINSTFRLAGTEGVTIAYTVAPLPSVGQPADIAKLEDDNLSSLGITNKVGFPVVKPATKVVDGAQYVVYTYDIARSVPNKAGTGTATQERYKIVLAVNSAATLSIAALDGDAVAE